MEYKYESQIEKMKNDQERDELVTNLWTKANELESVDKEASKELRKQAMERYRSIKAKYILLGGK